MMHTLVLVVSRLCMLCHLVEKKTLSNGIVLDALVVVLSWLYTLYLDFEKAFDNVDHGILLHKLRDTGITGKLDIVHMVL